MQSDLSRRYLHTFYIIISSSLSHPMNQHYLNFKFHIFHSVKRFFTCHARVSAVDGSHSNHSAALNACHSEMTHAAIFTQKKTFIWNQFNFL